MSSGQQAGEIFMAAGAAFTKLSELTALLSMPETVGQGNRWEPEDTEHLRSAVKKFGEELNQITERVKMKSELQMRKEMKKKHDLDIKMDNNTISST